MIQVGVMQSALMAKDKYHTKTRKHSLRQCFRHDGTPKAKLDPVSAQEAVENAFGLVVSYQCGICDFWHVGKPSNG